MKEDQIWKTGRTVLVPPVMAQIEDRAKAGKSTQDDADLLLAEVKRLRGALHNVNAGVAKIITLEARDAYIRFMDEWRKSCQVDNELATALDRETLSYSIYD